MNHYRRLQKLVLGQRLYGDPNRHGALETASERKHRKRNTQRARGRGGYQHEQAHRAGIYYPPKADEFGLYPWDHEILAREGLRGAEAGAAVRKELQSDPRCVATTRTGKRCKRQRTSAGNTCRQHTTKEKNK